jgi:Ca2+-binding RTX toxin-like protein
MAYRYGTNFSEYLAGTDSDDYVYGYGGNDTLDGWNGVDVMYGGDGNDWVYGGRGADMLYGGYGNDYLYGQQDNDRFMGAIDGWGNDVIDGGDGYDTVDYSGAGNAMVIGLKQGRVSGGAYGDDLLFGIENAVGGEGGDIIHGTEAGLFGLGGENVLEGRGGADWIYAHSGNDRLYGGASFDVLDGGDGNDKLYGEADVDFLYGGYGDDQLYGGDGNDTLYDGYGNDYVDGGAGYDTVSYANATGAVEMPHNTQGHDTFANIEAVVGSNYDDWLDAAELGPNAGHTLDGGKGHDYLDGANGNDLIIGGEGNDVLRGSGGTDVLLGGAGQDQFWFNDLPGEHDSGTGAGYRDAIADLQHGVDVIHLYTDLVSPGAPQPTAMSFIGQSAFTHERQVRYGYEGADTTVVQVNMDTDAAAEFEIEIYGHVALSQGDFHFGTFFPI